MRRTPGDLAYVPAGSYLRSVSSNEERWNESTCLVTVITVGLPHVIEAGENIEGLAIVLIPGMGLYFVEESCVLSQEEYADPSRLFASSRLREW